MKSSTMVRQSVIAILFGTMAFSATVNAEIKTTSISNQTVSQVESQLHDYVKQVHQQNVTRKLLAQLDAPIKTQSDFDAVVTKSSPLDLLSFASKSRFIEGAVFTKDGLASFTTTDLEAELTISEIHDVLSMFGQQHLLKFFQNGRIENEKDMMLLKLAEEPDHQLSWGRSSGGAIGIVDTDYEGYACSDIATCKKAVDHICIGSNCK